MKTLTIREACEGLSHPEQMFAGHEVLAVSRGELATRILPATPRSRFRSPAAFRAIQPLREIPSEVPIRADRGARD